MRLIICDDGTILVGSTDSELISNAEAHFRDAHPRLTGRLSREEILAMAIEDAAIPAGERPASGRPERSSP